MVEGMLDSQYLAKVLFTSPSQPSVPLRLISWLVDTLLSYAATITHPIDFVLFFTVSHNSELILLILSISQCAVAVVEFDVVILVFVRFHVVGHIR